MKRMRSIVLLLMFLSFVAEARIWKNRTGKELEADYVKQAFGDVTLRGQHGKLFRIRISQLVPEDQKYIQSLAPSVPPSQVTTRSAKTGIRAGDPEVVALMKPGDIFSRKADGDTGISYCAYVPTAFKTNAPPPMIIAFSPGGSGRQMVNAIRASAEKVGWIVIGCDGLKNGMKDEETEEKMEDEVLNDIFGKIPNDSQRIYLAGFSGGAMRAYGISARRKETIAGIMAYGGWLGGSKYFKKPYCRHMAVAIVNGDEDKGANSWAERDAKALKSRKCHVKHFSFAGGHAIAPPNVTDDCITWLQQDWEKHGAKRH